MEEQRFDLIVVGGGHAGCEAVHSAARLGLSAALITLELAKIAYMSCNPSIGGPAKGHLTREIDALGVLQGRITDATYLSIRMLNTGKGASVRALRAQSDRNGYSREMRRVLEATRGVTLIEGEVGEVLTTPPQYTAGSRDFSRGEVELATEVAATGVLDVQPGGTGGPPVKGATPASPGPVAADPPVGQAVCRKAEQGLGPYRQVQGVRLTDGREYAATRVVICPGTFTRAECFMGERRHRAGRWGETSADAMGESLERDGMALQRLKTGTSPRIDSRSVDYTRLDPQLSEWRDDAFENYAPSMLPAWFLPNWLGKTTEQTRDLILARQHESALYSGAISGAGPRYCPSIEDKVVRFPGAQVHPVFIEPDGLDVNILYLQGLSTSLPLDVQREFLHTIPGLAAAKIRRPGYAVEYDSINPINLQPTLEYRQIAGLYCAGQFNGTSGYEEAAAQGLVAGANAALSLLGREPLPVVRDNSYIGVLVDDLTTRGTEEPYRMLTARAEHRLLLRHDNAALRLGPIARDWGLLSAEQVQALDALRMRVHAVQAELEATRVSAERQRELGIDGKSGQGISGTDAVRRGAGVGDVLEAPVAQAQKPAPPDEVSGRGRAPARPGVPNEPRPTGGSATTRPDQQDFISRAAAAHVEVEIQYAGYLARARAEAERVRQSGDRRIPPDFDYAALTSLLKATREKLEQTRPRTIGQAGRVAGVTPADLANLLVAVRRYRAE
jgi:tRNA uridine 5-carboxymethylaminomethyl modification enzyme